jgi:putative DNA methylase
LPHFDDGIKTQFITLHLSDALPKKVIQKWKMELEREKDEVKQIILFQRVEKYIDQGYGKCWLNKPFIAETVQESLLHFDSVRYKLFAWVMMPNHTHFLLKPINNFSLSEIMQKHKSHTAHKCNKLIKRKGAFWQTDYYDRYIRDFEHFQNTVRYIENNPVKAGLCIKPEDWNFSSSCYRKR